MKLHFIKHATRNLGDLNVRHSATVFLIAISLLTGMATANAAPLCQEIFRKLDSDNRQTAREIVLNHNDFLNSKNQKFIDELWLYFHKNVWTKKQGDIARQLVRLSVQKKAEPRKFVELLKELKDLSGTRAKNFIEFEQFPREYLSVLQSKVLMEMEFYGPEHVILYLTTGNAWSTKVETELTTTARSKAALARSKADVLELPNPKLSGVEELKLIEKKISIDLLSKASWNERTFQDILSIAEKFKKGVEYYRAGEDTKGNQIVDSAVNSLIAFTSSNPEMNPISYQEAYSLLSRLSGGSLNIKKTDSELVLTAVAGLAKNYDANLAQELEAYMTLRIQLRMIIENPTIGNFAEKSMAILKLSPEEIL